MVEAVKIIPENHLLSYVLAKAQIEGWLTHHTYDSRKAPRGRGGMKLTDKGFPDIIALRPATEGRNFRKLAAELKREDEPVTKDQLVWLAFLNIAGFETYIWRPHDQDWIDVVLEE